MLRANVPAAEAPRRGRRRWRRSSAKRISRARSGNGTTNAISPAARLTTAQPIVASIATMTTRRETRGAHKRRRQKNEDQQQAGTRHRIDEKRCRINSRRRDHVKHRRRRCEVRLSDRVSWRQCDDGEADQRSDQSRQHRLASPRGERGRADDDLGEHFRFRTAAGDERNDGVEPSPFVSSRGIADPPCERRERSRVREQAGNPQDRLRHIARAEENRARHRKCERPVTQAGVQARPASRPS